MVAAAGAVEAACRHVLAALDKAPSPDDQNTADFRCRLDAAREDNSGWFLSNQMLGGVC